jgi:glycosyltransferase involved in cell wall biosynthesis
MELQPYRWATTEGAMDTKRAVFVGMARNCAWFLPTVIQNIEELAKGYRETSVIIVENDSTDSTKSILRSWLSDRPNGKLIELDGLAIAEPKRTQRIATTRNAALDHIRSSFLRDWDHLIVIDLDEVNTHPISCDRFAKAVSFLENDLAVAGVFANQVNAYYDLWALRKKGWCNDDCWKQVANKPKWLSFSLAKIIYVFSRQVAIPEGANPVRVTSAFGGLGVYKISSIGTSRYVGLDTEQMEVCEHVSFNSQISRNGRLFIYPSLVNQAPISHLVNPGDYGRRDLLILNLIGLWNLVFPPWKNTSD